MLLVCRLQTVAEKFVPRPLLRMCRNVIWIPIRHRYGQLPVSEAFTQVYRNNLWGKIDGEEYFSGRGSLDEFARPYVEWVVSFINEHNIKTVVDLGCGDFRIGQRICAATSVNYVGVDIVAELISHNQSQYGNSSISFQCTNIIEDELPDGQLCLIRQVFQHLSNWQISSVLAKCVKYPYLLVTEDVYNGRGVRPNLDMSHGPDNRLFKRSGVFLDYPPFNLVTETILEAPRPMTFSTLRTSVIVQDRDPHQYARIGFSSMTNHSQFRVDQHVAFQKNARNVDLSNSQRQRTLKKKIEFFMELTQSFGNMQGKKMVEIGCGTGLFTECLAARAPSVKIFATDVFPEILEIAKRRLNRYDNVQCLTFDAEAIDSSSAFLDGFDIIYGVDVLHHLEDPVLALGNWIKISKPGSRLIFIEPNAWNLALYLRESRRPEEARFKYSTRSNVVRWLKESGWKSVEARYAPLYLPNGPKRLWDAFATLENLLHKVPPLKSMAGCIVLTARAPPTMRRA